MRWIVVLFWIPMLAQISFAATQVTTMAEVDAGSDGIEVDSAGNVYSSDFGPRLGNSPVTGET